MGDYTYWTNGIATIPETPENARVRHRSDFGTIVEQDANTEGWFHIPLTTPSRVNNDGSFHLNTVYLTANLNIGATLDLIHIRHGTDLIFVKPVEHNNRGVLFSSLLGVDSPYLPESVDVDGPGTTMNIYNSGLVMSIHIKFTAPNGRVEFKCAGVHFTTV